MRERVVALVGPARAQHVGVDVPLHLRADPAQPGLAAAGAELQLLDLRRRRLAPPAADDRQGHGPGHQAVLAAAAGQRHLQPEERADRPRTGGRRGLGGRRRSGAHRRRGLRRVPAPAARGQRAGLRRPDRRDGRCAAGLSADRPVLPAAVPAHPGRRVPGHQPRAVRAGARTRGRSAQRTPTRCRRRSCASSATPTSRSTRSAARPSATSRTSSATSPTPQRFCWSRTTARRRTSCRRPTR